MLTTLATVKARLKIADADVTDDLMLTNFVSNVIVSSANSGSKHVWTDSNLGISVIAALH